MFPNSGYSWCCWSCRGVRFCFKILCKVSHNFDFLPPISSPIPIQCDGFLRIRRNAYRKVAKSYSCSILQSAHYLIDFYRNGGFCGIKYGYVEASSVIFIEAYIFNLGVNLWQFHLFSENISLLRKNCNCGFVYSIPASIKIDKERLASQNRNRLSVHIGRHYFHCYVRNS